MSFLYSLVKSYSFFFQYEAELAPPQGGKHGRLVRTTEDARLAQNRPTRKQLQQIDPMGDDYMATHLTSPFVMHDVNSRLVIYICVFVNIFIAHSHSVFVHRHHLVVAAVSENQRRRQLQVMSVTDIGVVANDISSELF
jgi:hypothetical protein